MPRVGDPGTNIGPASLPPIEAFREGLRQLGYTEGQNIIVEYRWAQGPADPEATAHAAELVRLDLDLAVAANSTYVPLFRRASSTIPIVFCISFDPVAEGIVASLARPGGNSSGLSVAPAAYLGKILELLTEAGRRAASSECHRTRRTTAWPSQHSKRRPAVWRSSFGLCLLLRPPTSSTPRSWR